MPPESPRTLSLDSLVRAMFGILQVVIFASTGWLFSQVIAHDGRITRVEMRTEMMERISVQTADTLRAISDRQQTILQMFAELRPELARVKIDLSTVMEKLEAMHVPAETRK